MCGITGFVDFKKNSSLELAVAMAASLIHRGPDDEGAELIQHDTASIGLGFRRLSIIELSKLGHQPMYNPDQGTWITFNGEIYNYKEIRAELEYAGYQFVSHSDTEVILKGYQAWGLKIIDRLIGMFAIVLLNPREDKIHFIRDRAGVKPFYYYQTSDLFLYASELKALHQHPGFKKEIDPDALALYFRHGYIPAPYSIFKKVCKLEPGHHLTLDLHSGKAEKIKYWDAQAAYNKPVMNISWEDALQETEKLMQSAFQYRMVADVPVGVFLSGGYDSSCVAALLQKDSSSKIKTYTIGFEEQQFNEAEHARKVAEHLGTDHKEYFCKTDDAKDIVPELAHIFDEPFGDSSAIPTTLVSRIARKQVTVALSADAGDELFAGYPRHPKSLQLIRLLQGLPNWLASGLAGCLTSKRNNDLSQADRLDKLKSALRQRDTYSLFRIINETYTIKEIGQLMKVSFNPSLNTAFDKGENFIRDVSTLARMLCLEYESYLVDDLLQKVDRATMSASLEGRDPFLDHRLLEWTAVLPDEFKLKNGEQKRLLKAIVHRHLPPEIMDRPKMGFGIPVAQWLLTDLRDLFEETMSEKSLAASGLLDIQEVMKIVEAYRAGKLENFERLWYIFIFQLWFKKWM